MFLSLAKRLHRIDLLFTVASSERVPPSDDNIRHTPRRYFMTIVIKCDT